MSNLLSRLPVLAAFSPWTVTSWPTMTGVMTLCLAVIMGSFLLWRQRRNLELAWGEIARVWERGLARVNALGDLMPDIILETDEHRTVTFANRAFFRITGYSEKDLQAGMDLTELLEPADRPGLGKELATAGAGHPLGVRHCHLRRPDGESVAVALHLAPIEESGEIRGWRGILQDLDARERLETATRPVRPSVESVINAILKDFARTPPERHAETVARALAVAGRHLGADRCYQYRLREDRLESCELWYAEGVTPLTEDQVLPGLDRFPWVTERFRRGLSLRLADVAALPDEAHVERERWRAQGITSLLAVPLRDGDEIVGVLGCETLGQRRDWDDRDVQLLDSVAEICLRVHSQDCAERALQQAHRLLHAVVHVVPDPAFVVDAETRIVAWNSALSRLTGVSATAMVGRHGRDGAEAIFGAARPLPVDSLLGGSLTAAEPQEIHVARLRGGQGAYLRVSAQPLHDPEGRTIGGVQILQDITTHKRQEQEIRAHAQDLERRVADTLAELRRANDALQASESRFRRLVESMRDGYIFYSLDADRRFTYISPSVKDVLGFTSGAPLEAVLPPGPDLQAAPESAAASGRVFEIRVRRRDGQGRVLQVLEVPVLDRDGRVQTYDGLARDITDERHNLEVIRRAQDRLVESEKMAAMGRLLAGLAHEINTPIGVGLTAATHLDSLAHRFRRLYEQGELTRSQFEKFLADAAETSRMVHGNMQNAADLVSSIKQVAVDQSRAEPRAIPVREYLGDVLLSLRPRLKARNVTVELDCPEPLVLMADPGALYRVVSNLLLNSLAHAYDGRENGVIRLTVQSEGDDLVLDYRDDGAGMAPDVVERLYEPFYTTARARGGTGLGMHIVYNMVTGHLGGSIQCRSERGQGTQFVITLPRGDIARAEPRLQSTDTRAHSA